MDGCRKALYSYSWQQSPINKRRRVNLPDEEKKIFDDWFEEKADEYVPWIRNHGSDHENVHANDFWMTSLSPCNPEIHKILVRVSPRILEPLQRPKQDRKTIKEEMHKETERLTNIIRYEKSLKGTRKTIDVIKKEKRKKPIFFQTQQQRLFDSTVFREYSTCIASDKLSSFREELCDMSECAKQTASSESKQRTPEHHNDNSDNELLRLALESSPISKSDSALKVASNEDELTDEALLAMMLSSPASNPKLKNNRWSADLCQLLS
ncbi:unnamed protein product [Onchocerca flexuosa]|uniref:Uncharacterized protein n=1 Tax=Onchocerca flexuosa TaxID=387005 RepID=A0A183GYJ1_9BILA|nr:unnamed protein product [Onchocerca flexuosa]